MQMNTFNSAFSLQPSALACWLPDMDLNHDKQIQSLLCYRYTIGQAGALGRLKNFFGQSSRQTTVPEGREKVAHGFNRGLSVGFLSSPAGTKENAQGKFLSPLRGLAGFGTQIPQLKLWAVFGRPAGAAN
jgi:hypothetical protein